MKLALLLLLLAAPASAQTTVEARSLAISEHTLYVGTSAGTIYTSKDDGRTWQGLTQFRKDYVIDKILVDGERIYVAAWTMGDRDKGSFFRSMDSGKTWELTETKPFRALALIHGCPVKACYGNALYAGGVDGLYVSTNAGENFTKMDSPIKDIQSIAIDPASPAHMWVGTWHLGYYTANGGVTWHSVHKGIINDSDFFSIVFDDGTIYIGACSGIYKGTDDGEQFRKEKTKTDARRTKVLQQVDHRTLYAGTTDGVWITTDAGKTWKRRGNRYITVNDMLATSPKHLVVATLHHGVIWSDDGGKHYTESQFAPNN